MKKAEDYFGDWLESRSLNTDRIERQVGMDTKVLELLKKRHSVRAYTDKPVEAAVRSELQAEVDKLNQESGLQMQLFFDEPGCFKADQPHYGKFENARNYLAIVGRKAPDLEERAGYYGEKFVRAAQEHGVNSCWVAMTHSTSKAVLNTDEKLVIIIALGYGKMQGVSHKSKPMEKLCETDGEMPDWFKAGMEAAMLAPTAMNLQRFTISYKNGKLTAKAGLGPFSKIDLGIVKSDFEAVSGHSF